MPGKPVCGVGMHEHDPHLTIVLTDGSIRLNTADGVSRELELKSGLALWSYTELHAAVNTGTTDMKVLLVFLK